MLGCEGKIEIRQKNQQPAMIRKLLIFSVDQPGLEPGTSRL